MTLRIGSTFSGYGGLDLAVMEVLGGQVVWHCENDPAGSAVLAHHWPTVPNLGDITAVDWSTVEPVDILTSGFPCQDISFAGRGAGIEGARSGLWRYLADAVRVLRPRVVVLENVSAVLVRGLDRVLADLASCGYDVRWTCLRASDVGAPHRRNRWFAVAQPADAPSAGRGWHEPKHVSGDGQEAFRQGQAKPGRCGRDASDADGERSVRSRDTRGRRDGLADHGHAAADPEGDGWPEGRPEPARFQRGPHAAVGGDVDQCDYCGCPTGHHDEGGFCAGPCGGNCASEQWGRPDGGWNSYPDDTPPPRGLGIRVAADSGRDTRPEDHADIPAASRSGGGAAAHADGSAHGTEPHGEPKQLKADDQQRRLDPAGRVLEWGQYEPAIRRWEAIIGRPAPEPTVVGRRGGRQLNPAFVEWMMGVPGHITSVPGLSRNDMLRLAGNGVVPQQGAAALRWLLSLTEERAA